MMNRRELLQAAGAALAVPGLARAHQEPQAAEAQRRFATGDANRRVWYAYGTKLAEPVLRNLAAGTLRARMPVEQAGMRARSVPAARLRSTGSASFVP